MTWSRRHILAAVPASLAVSACARPSSDEFWRDLESTLSGGRIGVFAKDHRTGQTMQWRADERFAMCSTFKWLLAAFVVADVFDGRAYITPPTLAISADDLLFHSPVVRPQVEAGETRMDVTALCQAATSQSDNAAANILLRTIGGPDGFTRHCRALGDNVTRLDRWEVALNENAAGDVRDTTTASAMSATLYNALYTDALLSAENNTRIKDWMLGTTTGKTRMIAGVPDGYRLGHKTGTSANGAVNDIGFIIRPDEDAPIILSTYINAPDASLAEANAAHAQIAETVIRQFA